MCWNYYRAGDSRRDPASGMYALSKRNFKADCVYRYCQFSHARKSTAQFLTTFLNSFDRQHDDVPFFSEFE